MNDRDLSKRLAAAGATTIVVIGADGNSRNLPVPGHTRKKWTGIIAMATRMEWVRLECVDAKGGLLDVIDNPDAMSARESYRTSGDPQDQALKRMIDAQREALTWQDKSVRAALDTCVQVMREMNGALTGIMEMHRIERDNLRQLIKEIESAGAAGGGDELPSSALVAQLAPVLLHKLMAAGMAPPAAAGGKKPNGKPEPDA